MKVVLINPRSKHPEEIQQKCFAPVNLLYIASSLIENGCDAEIIDANAFGFTDKEIVELITNKQPDLIGVSLLSELTVQTHHLSRRIKQTLPDAKIVLGGPHANAMPDAVLAEFKDIDFVLTGESENSIVSLCRALENKIAPGKVPGLYFRKAGRIAGSDPENPVQDLDRLKHPARELLSDAYNKKKYFMVLVKQRPVETILTSRGCPFQCRFCSNIPGSYRYSSPENVMEEMVDRYSGGIRNFDIADANFTLDRRRAMDIFDLIIKEKLRISFRFKSRADSVSEELVQKAKQAGAYLISLGMESGSQEMLSRMNKKTTIEKNILACETVMKAGLKLNTGWIIGFPGETLETIDQTVKMIITIKPTTANIGRLVPYPGTDVYAAAKADKSLVGDWSIHNDFIPWIKLPWIKSCAHLEKITQQVKNRVYYRPHYMINFAKEIMGNLNVTLAQYAFQEARKSFR